MKDYLAVVGADPEVELRDGQMQFTFAVADKAYVRYGDRELAPDHGFGTAYMQDGVWGVESLRLHGRLIGKKGAPVNREISFLYSFDGGFEAEGSPDYVPPQWLIAFVADFENRVSGRTREEA